MTKTTSFDRLSAVKPSLAQVQREAVLSRIVASPRGATEPPWATSGQLRYGHPNRRREIATVGAVVAIAAGTGVPLAFSAAGHATSTEVHLASYSFKLPGRYHQAQSAVGACQPGFLVTWPAGTFDSPKQMLGLVNGHPDEPGIVSAASTAGGCISMALVGPYAPGGPEVPTVEGIGGPLWHGTAPQQVQVGQYQALLGSFTMPDLKPGGAPMPPSAGQTLTVLEVTVPAAGGQVQDLVATSTQLSEQALVSMVAQGLSNGASTSATTTAAAPATTGSAQ